MVEINVYEMILQVASFLVLLYVLQKLLYKPLMSFMAKRREEVAGNLHDSEKERAEASDILAEQRKLLAEARDEASNILEKAHEIGQNEQQTIVNKARQEAAELVEQAREEVRLEARAAKEELANEVGRLAADIAGRVLEKEVNPQLVDSFIDQLETLPGKN